MSGLVVKKKVTTLDKIRKYYLKGPDSVSLTPKQDEIRTMIYKAWNLMINYHSREQAMQVVMNEYNTSRAQAYRYVADAMSVFGNPLENSKEAKRYLIEEDLMRLQQQVMKDKDWAMSLKVIAQRIKIGGFDKDKDPKFDPEKLAAQVYILKTDPAVLEYLKKSQDGGSYDFNMVDTQDIEYKEVEEGDDDED